MKKTIISISFLVITSFTFSQTLPNLTKQQMYADFDTLSAVLIKINPCDYVRRIVNNYSMNDSILALRKNIDTISSAESFFWLVNKALTYCQEGHTGIARSYHFDYLDSTCAVRCNSTSSDINIIKQYDKIYKSKVKSYKLKLPIKYVNGEYRVLCDFKYKEKLIPQSYIITDCNNQNIHKYINQLVGTAQMMHWDFEKKQFYIDNFNQFIHLPATEKITLTFSGNGKNLVQSFSLNDTVILNKNLKYQQTSNPKVLYFENDKLLYVRIPQMDNDEFYLTKIDSVFKRNEVKKVVIDIRDNPGGGDNTWRGLIRLLIDKTIKVSYVSCVNINNSRKDKLFFSVTPKVYKNNFIKKDSFLLFEDMIGNFDPDSNSLHFKGKIYVIENENCFSSATSFISMCQFSDQFVSVGNSTGWFAGLGMSPWVFMLPNSRILYRTEPVLDFANIKKPEDLYHNNVELPINMTIDDYNTRYSYPDDWYDKEFLYKFDKAFKTILKDN